MGTLCQGEERSQIRFSSSSTGCRNGSIVGNELLTKRCEPCAAAASSSCGGFDHGLMKALLQGIQ